MSDFIKPAYSRNVYPDEIVTSSGSALSTELDALDGVTASAAELNKLDNCTATTAELNLVDAIPASFTLAAAAGGANVCEVTITAKDAAGATLAAATEILVWLSDAATGLGITGTAASGTVQAKAASGTDLAALTAKKCLLVQTKADGTYILEITDAAKTLFYVCARALHSKARTVSAQLAADKYGA